MSRLRITMILLFAFMSLGIVSTESLAQETPDIPEVVVSLKDDGVTFTPSDISAGITTLVFDNERTKAPFQGLIARFREGVTMDDLKAAAGDQLATVQLLRLYGGVVVPPGTQKSIIADLKPGTHVFLESPTLRTFFEVGPASMDSAAQPEADVTLAMVDFAFGTPSTVAAGEQLWHIQNVGQQFHEAIMIKIDENTTSEEAAALLTTVVTPTGQFAEDSPAQLVFAWPPMDPGENVWVTINLEPGTYAIGCVLPDLTLLPEMHTHLEHGMIRIFTVE